MKESRDGRNGGTSPVRPGRGETRRTGGDRTEDRTADVTGPKEGRSARDAREKESERAKEKAGARNGSEKQSETYELILIGGDSGEYGLREYEGLVRLLLEVHDRLRRARVRPLHQVDPRLVLVHGVQDQLQIIGNCIAGVQTERRDAFANKHASPVNARFSKINASPHSFFFHPSVTRVRELHDNPLINWQVIKTVKS